MASLDCRTTALTVLFTYATRERAAGLSVAGKARKRGGDGQEWCIASHTALSNRGIQHPGANALCRLSGNTVLLILLFF